MSLPTLYALAEEYRAAAEALADLDMPPEVVSDTLDGLSGQLQHKASNVAMVVRNLEATAEAIEAAEKTMRERRKAIEARADWLRSYLLDNMQRTGIQRIDSPWLALVVRDNPAAVVVDDPADPEGACMLWMSKADVGRNMMSFGRDPALVQAWEAYEAFEKRGA